MIILALVALLTSRVAAEPGLRFKAGATASQAALTDTPGLTLGGALALTRWAPLSSLTFAPQVELLFARRRAPVAVDEAGSASYSLDLIELPVLLHSELTLGSRSLYALAGGYGSVLLQAQRTTAGGMVDHADVASFIDIGLLAAGGLELGSLFGGELFVEMRWQRGRRALMRESGGKHEAVSVLLGYGLAAEPGDGKPRAQDRRLAVTGGLVATRLRAPGLADSAYSAGYSLGGAFSPARLGSWVALVPQLELAFVHRSMHEAAPAGGALALDSLDLSLLVRGELAVAGASIYGAGGVYGSALLRAQRTRDGVTTDVYDTVSSADAGWLAGVGVEGIKLGATAGATLSLELRYQRGLRDLLPAGPGDVTQQSVALLLGVAQGAPPRAGPAPRPRAGPASGGGKRALATGEDTPARSEGTGTTESLESLSHGLRLAALGPLPASPALGLNADMTVLCLRGGKTLKKWRGQAMWNGPMPARYRGAVGRGGIEWEPEGLDAATLRVNIELDGTGGEPLRAWMHQRTRTVVVIIKPRQLATGSGSGLGPDSEARRRSHAAPGLDPAGTSSGGIGRHGKRASQRGSARTSRAARGRGPGASGSSAGKPGGSPRGKPGGDTAEEGGVDGEHSRITGEKFGAAHGAIGGHGADSDFGARGAMALFGGILDVPAAIRPAVEIALAIQDANLPGLGKKLLKRAMHSFTSPVAARTAFAGEARRYARKRYGAIYKKLSAERAFRKLSKEEQKRVLRVVSWDLQRQYFAAIENAAIKEQRALHKKLSRTRSPARKATLEKELVGVDTVVEAVKVKPVAGRLPRNHKYAGKWVPPEELHPKYRNVGLRFTDQGFPDFEPHAVMLPDGRKHVKIKLTGRRKADVDAANRAAGLYDEPIGYVWHHHEEAGTMMLVPQKLHRVAHTGGAAIFKHITGVARYD